MLEAEIGTSAEFTGNGYLELPQDLLPHGSPTTPEVIELSVRTTQNNALLFWYGQTPTTPGRAKDHVAIAIENGRIVFRFECFFAIHFY